MIGARPNDPFLSRHMTFLDELWQKSSEPKYTSLFPKEWYMHWTGSGFLGADFFDFARGENIKALFVPISSFAANHNLRSWGDKNQTTRFGNTPIQSQLPIFSVCPKGEEEKHAAWKAVGGSYLNILRPEMGEVLYGITKEQAVLMREELFEQSRKIYFSSSRKQIGVIPHISHRMWLTPGDKPSEVPLEQLGYYVQSCRVLNEAHGDWQHFFWCLDLSKITQTIQFLIEADVGIQVRVMDDLYPRMRAKHVFDAVLKEKLITKAGNIGRLAAIAQYGGIYCDIGIKLKPNIAPLIDCYKALWWLWPANRDNLLDLCVVGAAPGNAIIEGFFDVVDRLWETVDVNDPRLADLVRGVRSTDWLSAPLIHACLSRYGAGMETLFVGDGSFAESNRLNSWGQWLGEQPTKFGLKPVSQSTLDIFALRPPEGDE